MVLKRLVLISVCADPVILVNPSQLLLQNSSISVFQAVVLCRICSAAKCVIYCKLCMFLLGDP